MQKYINDTMKYCKQYIIAWFISLGVGVLLIFMLISGLVISNNTVTPYVTTDEAYAIPILVILFILIFVDIALSIWALVVYILLIVNLTKLESVLGNSYQTYFILSIVGIFIPIIDLVACFLIKRDLSEYKQPEESKPDLVQPKVEEMSVSKQ